MKRRFLLLLALSLLLHLGVVGLLLSRPRAPLPTEKPVELVLFEVSLPPPPAAEVAPEPPLPARRPTPSKPAPVAAAPKPEPTPLAEAPPQSEVPTSDIPIADSPRVSGPPLPSASLAWSLDAGESLEEQQVGLHAPSISKDLVADLTRETIGRGKVDRGLVHPYYSQLGKALLRNWDADRAVSSAGLKGFLDQMADNSVAWNKIWLENAERFGKSGSAFDSPTNVRGASRSGAERLIPGQDLAARREVAKAMSEQMRQTKRAHIRVVQDKTGKLIKVELVKPSNDANVDRQAIVDVRSAAEKLPPPPEEAFSGRQTLVSIWEFELVISISPPVPTFTFEFDEVIGFVDARLPLDRRIYKQVRLLAVE